jgi:hypothetical protein
MNNDVSRSLTDIVDQVVPRLLAIPDEDAAITSRISRIICGRCSCRLSPGRDLNIVALTAASPGTHRAQPSFQTAQLDSLGGLRIEFLRRRVAGGAGIMANQSQTKRLAQAGLVDPDALDDKDRALLEQLTESEVTVLLQIVNRLYPEARSMVKVGDLTHKLVRLCVPL